MKQLIQYSISFFLLGTSSTAFSDFACRNVPDGSLETPVSVCETTNSYKIIIGDSSDEYEKSFFQSELKNEISNWVESTALAPEDLCGSKINFWLSIPETNPYATQARVEISNSQSNFLVYLSPRLEDWNVNNDKVSILEQEDYPDAYGYLSGKLVIKGKKGTTKRQLDQYLSQYDAIEGELISGLWYSYNLEAFSESETIDRIEADPFSNFFVEKLGTNTAFEWISAKESVFNFTWDCE